MQYIFLEKNFIFMVLLAVKNVIQGYANEISFVRSYKNALNEVSSGKLNSQKDYEDKGFL